MKLREQNAKAPSGFFPYTGFNGGSGTFSCTATNAANYYMGAYDITGNLDKSIKKSDIPRKLKLHD